MKIMTIAIAMMATVVYGQTVEVYNNKGVMTNKPGEQAEAYARWVQEYDEKQSKAYAEPTIIPSLLNRDMPGWVPPESVATPTPTPTVGIQTGPNSFITPNGAVTTKLFPDETPTPTTTPAATPKRHKIVIKPTATAVASATPHATPKPTRRPWWLRKDDDDPLGLKPSPSETEPSRRDKPLGLSH
jgi:hypothetical protein